jgi:tetratricopeptide (TPR) repeat protein
MSTTITTENAVAPPPLPPGAAATVPNATASAVEHSETELSLPHNLLLLESVYVPSETELTLLCWDYLRHDCLRRQQAMVVAVAAASDSGSSHSADTVSVSKASALQYSYQTLACWALYQSLVTEQSASSTNTTSAKDGTTGTDSDSNDNDTEPQPQPQPQQQQQPPLHGDILQTLPSLADMQSTLMRYQFESSFTGNCNTNAVPVPVSLSHGQTATLDEDTKETKEADEDYLVHTTNNESSAVVPADKDAFTPFRLYGAHGLADTDASLSLQTVTTAGCLLLSASSRRAAELDFCRTPLFGHFCAACHAKGFFAPPLPLPPNDSMDASTSNTNTNAVTVPTDAAPLDPTDPLFIERFAKVVTKFRQKLLHHQYTPPMPHLVGFVNADSVTNILEALAYTASTAVSLQQHQQDQQQPSSPPPPQTESTLYLLAGGVVPIPSAYVSSRRPMVGPDSAWTTTTPSSTPLQQQQQSQSESNGPPPSSPFSTAATRTILGTTPPSSSSQSLLEQQPQYQGHPDDLAEAEAFKQKGNTHMQRQEYQLAWDCYTAALSRSPSGPHSHVYYANRAAAAVSLQRLADAVADAQRSLALSPDYAKAHARLGLAHFLSGHYRHAISAYTAALKYEPDNASSRHYLTKAAQRLAAEEQAGVNGGAGSTTLPPPPLSSAPSTDGTHTSHNETATTVRQVPSNSSWSSRAGDSVKSHSAHGARQANTTSNSTLMPPLTAAEREAELAKSQGNALMASRDYAAALQAYTRALASSATGPQSHVYYANRAAAYCYLERYTDARDDAVAALALQPTYGKAHARLGLALFCSKDYAGAVAAYETALVHDPHNTAAQSYLHKAQAKVAKAAAAAANSGKAVPTTRPLSSSLRPQRQEH